MRALARLLPLFALLLFVAPALADGPHRLALQISDNDPVKMNAVLNVAANVSKYYSDKGEGSKSRSWRSTPACTCCATIPRR
jgi:hypothetical protein